LGRVGSKLGLLGAQCWARVGPGLGSGPEPWAQNGLCGSLLMLVP
ncbi:hypothetical protein PENANT_c405G04692, partial [Penicillium antarcticum]